MAKEVIIIESPTKIHTISGILPGKKIIATKGHFKDLPKDDMGVDLVTYSPDFTLSSPSAKSLVYDLKNECKGATVYIATDPDREGYAIGKMVYDEILSGAGSIMRAEFFEITPKGIADGLAKAVDFKNTNFNFYDAFLGRRIGDRMIGYIMSPKACREIGVKGHSVGRVKSVAIHIVVEREEAIIEFMKKPERERIYYKASVVIQVDGVALRASYDEDFENENDAVAFMDKLSSHSTARLLEISHKKVKDSPAPPFMTSDLLKEADTVFKFDSETTTRCNQKLFELGLITYIRVDSHRLSEDFIEATSHLISREFPLLSEKTQYKSKASQAEAHEAIRPSDHVIELIENEKSLGAAVTDIIRNEKISTDEENLLRLIYARAFSSQAVAGVDNNFGFIFSIGGFDFKATHSTIESLGYREVYKAILNIRLNGNKILNAKENDSYEIIDRESAKKKREAPKRYTEGELTKTMEKYGIGRPSTYSSYIRDIKKQEYVTVNDKRRLVPTVKAFEIITYLRKESPWVIDYGFTADMETFLDDISDGKKRYTDFCRLLHEKMGFSVPSTAPSKAQIDYAEQLAEKLGTQVPDDAKKNIAKLGKWIDSAKAKTKSMPYVPKPGTPSTDKMISFAEIIATKVGIALPDDIKIDAALLSKWITDNKELIPKSETQQGSSRLDDGKAISPPSEKMIGFANMIAIKKNLKIPAKTIESFKSLSDWINKHK
jgi:DNA topoisomerase I